MSRAPSRMLATLALALSLAASGPASGSVRPADMVSGVALSSVSDDSPMASAAPDLEMASGYLGTTDGKELWSRDADERRPMASTTKIMTAIVALESGIDPEEEVTVSKKAASVGQALVNLRAGDVRTARQLMEEMLVKSGNDAALALAEHIAGSEEAFVDRMNAMAVKLGLEDTRFENTHGLDEEGHYTTAHDLAELASVAMRDPEFRRIVCLPSVTVETANGASHVMENTNALMGDLEGLVGIKTGMTNKAGWCLVAQAERGKAHLVSVVLGSGSERARAEQSRLLLEWGFEHYGPREIASAEETLGVVPVSDYLDVSVPAHIAEATSALLFDLDGELSRRVELDDSVKAPVARGDRVGTLEVYQGEALVAEVPVTAAEAVRAPGLWERLGIAFRRMWASVFGVAAIPRHSLDS